MKTEMLGPDPDGTLTPQAATLRRVLPVELLRERKYEIGGVVAQGGMGAILDAREATIERQVAMKVMLDAGSTDNLLRFIAEAKITGQLEHPNIVPVHELGTDEKGQPFYTMKMVRGITLRKVIDLLAEGQAATVKKFPLGQLLTVFQKVCDALAFAHAKGVIHRDLKPENIMLGDFGEVLVMDWGLAKVIGAPEGARQVEPVSLSSAARDGRESSTMAGAIMGTPQYMSPEQARGEVETLDGRTDIYALGAILFHLLFLRAPIRGSDAMQIVTRVARGELDWPSTKDMRVVPESLLAVCRKALALDLATRYGSVEDLQRDISAFQNGFATSAERAGLARQLILAMKRNKVAALGAAAVLLVGTVFGTKALIEGRRAERTLGELRDTAPTFEAQSRALVHEGKLDEALAKIGYAVKLAPDNADYRLVRAHLFQSTQRLVEAAEEYRTVLAQRPGDAAAKTNLELCGKLLAEKGSEAQLSVTLQGRLLDALVAQHRDLEAAPLAKLLGRDTRTAEATLRARLASYTTQKGWMNKRIAEAWTFGSKERGFHVDLGTLQLGDLNALRDLPIVMLTLRNTSVSDLRPLTGLPLEMLVLNNTRVSDLSPLQGMKLRKLDISATEVSDLEPLAGMPLKVLDMKNTKKLRDLKPLAGMPLESLNADGTPITDLSPLRGAPLRELILHHNGREIPDLSPIAGSPALEKISLPWEILDVAFLTTLPKLQQVEYHSGNEPDVWMPVAAFLAMYGPEVPEIKTLRTRLAAAGVKDLAIWRIAVDSDKKLRVRLEATPLADLAPLRGLAIKELDLLKTSVSDLEPLRGMPLKKLRLANTKVSDIEPLRGMPLVTIHLYGSPVRDVGALADCTDLEEIQLTGKASNIERLRTLPKLRYLSARWDPVANRPEQTADEFWKEFDAKKAAGAQ